MASNPLPPDLAALRVLLEKATQGPWGTQPCSHGGLIVTRGPGESAPLKKRHPQSHLQVVPEADAAVIVALRNLAPRLLDAVERAAACIDRVLAIVGDSHGKPLAQIIGGISAAAHDARAHLAGWEG